MKYSIKPFIYNTDKEYATFLHNIHLLHITELNGLIENCYKVINSIYHELHWQSRTSGLLLQKKITRLSTNDIFITEIPTRDLYEMLKAYRDKILEYEKR